MKLKIGKKCFFMLYGTTIKNADNNMVFESYNFEMMMHSSNINFIKESFSL